MFYSDVYKQLETLFALKLLGNALKCADFGQSINHNHDEQSFPVSGRPVMESIVRSS